MTYIIYPRKSREDVEKEKRTGEDILATHRNRLVALCKKQKWQYLIMEEIVSGDTIAGRPVFQKILYEMLPTGNHPGIVVNDISRLGRGNMKDAGEIYQTLIEYQVKVVTPHKIYVPTNRADLRQIRFELFLSREEFELIRDRLEDGKDAAARAGRPAGNRWVLGLTSVRGKWVINKDELAVVEKAFHLVQSGYSLRRTADKLNGLGHRTSRGCRWTATSVGRLINNPHYEGYQVWKGETIPAEHGPLLPLELVHAARQRVDRIPPDSRRRNYFFYVPLICAKCGARMYGNRPTQKRDGISYQYPFYICSGKSQGCYTAVRSDKVHATIKIALQQLADNKKVQTKLIKRYMQTDNTSVIREIKRLQQELKAKEGRLEIIKMDYIEGRSDITTHNDAKYILTGQIKSLQSALRDMESKVATKNKNPAETIAGLKDVLQNWDTLDNSNKAKIVREYTEKVEYDSRTKEVNTILRLPM